MTEPMFTYNEATTRSRSISAVWSPGSTTNWPA
jgi:hypothetical protein